jgi:hypothetical protein
MYEFKVRIKFLLPPNNIGIAKWMGGVKENSEGIFKPLFEVRLEGSYSEPFSLTDEDLEFIEKPLIS